MAKTDRAVDKEPHSQTDDPVLAMLGIGRQLWEQEPGDRFVERLRSEDPPPSPAIGRPASRAEKLAETVWRRIEIHQGQQFHTATNLPFTYEVEGNGIWFYRESKRTNRKLTRAQVEVAISRCPLTATTEIKDLMDYAYLFALLVDRRIRGEDW